MYSYRNLSVLPRSFIKCYSTITHNCPYAAATTSFQHQKLICHHQKYIQSTVVPYRYLTQSPVRFDNAATTTKTTAKSSKDPQSNVGEYDTLTEYQAYDMIYKLSDNDRGAITKALSKYESDKIKSKFQGELASSKWRLQFGRRNNEPTLGAVDPTGSYCAMPDDWMKKKLAEAAVRPSNDALFKVFLVNGLPFIGFGFLDNFFMIIMGDYIESSIGIYMCLSTMAAAALGNTISDVLGLGLAHYVEAFCIFLGMEAPDLTPTQQNMGITQRIGSFGRAVGITIGCLLGMFPLLFINKEPKEEKK